MKRRIKRNIEHRAYQERCVRQVFDSWNNGARSVLVVAPPGSGKTEIAILVIREMLKDRPDARVLWVVHTRELARQAEERIEEAIGETPSVIMEGRLESSGARVTVAVVHSLLGHPPIAGIALTVLDEAHHYLADVWAGARFSVAGERRPLELGLTATPERDDGRPLGDIFDRLVVAAQYSELIAGGWIVPARVISPRRHLRSNYAQHPVDAWRVFSEGRSTIAFYPLVEVAEHYNTEFLARDVSAATLHSKLPDKDRELAFSRFERGDCKVLSTVSAAIEGLNVPHCGAAVLGRSFEFIGGYLQAAGRVLRASPGKPDGILIDLVGASVRHGPPDMDREYSLEGRAISGGGSGAVEREHSGIRAPEVLGVDMHVLAKGALQSVEDLPPPLELPPPDPERVKRSKEIREAVRRMHTRHGADAAGKLQKALEALYT